MTDTTKMISNPKNVTPSSATNYWMWIAAAEFVVIAFLVAKALNKRNKTSFESGAETILQESKSSTVDMNDLMNNINKARPLYKKLSAKCHPDRFATDEAKRQKADELFQEITKCQRNYSRLLELEQEAIRILNITH